MDNLNPKQKTHKEDELSHWLENLNTPLDQIKFVVFDLETTGGNPEKSGLTEVYGVEYDGEKLGKSFHSMVNPGRRIPPIVRKLTGITDAMVKEAPRANQVMPGFFKFIRGKVLVSHNTQSDLKFLEYYAKTLEKRKLNNFFLCTHLLASKLMADAKDKSLTGLGALLGLEQKPNHRAEEDTVCTVGLLKHLLTKLKKEKIFTLEEAIKLQGDLHSAIKVGWSIPQEELEKIPFAVGLLNFYNDSHKLIFSICSSNCKGLLHKIKDFAKLPKGLARLVLKSDHIAFAKKDNLLAAKIEENFLVDKNKFAFKPERAFRSQTKGIAVNKLKNGSYRISLAHASAGDLHFFSNFYDYKSARGFLAFITQRFFQEKLLKEEFVLSPSDFEFFLTLLRNNRLQSSLMIVRRSVFAGDFSFAMKCFQGLGFLGRIITDKKIEDVREISGILLIRHSARAPAWSLYPIFAGVLGENLTIKKNYATWFHSDQGKKFINDFFTGVEKVSRCGSLKAKEAILINSFLWYRETTLDKESLRKSILIKSDNLNNWIKDLK